MGVGVFCMCTACHYSKVSTTHELFLELLLIIVYWGEANDCVIMIELHVMLPCMLAIALTKIDFRRLFESSTSHVKAKIKVKSLE